MSEKNEKILYTVLRKVSKDRQFIIDAYRNWSRDRDSVGFDADSLVRYFELKLGIDANEKRDFRISFYAISSRDESVLLEVPDLLKNSQSAVHSAADEEQIAPESKLTAEEKTFQAFINTLLDSAKKVDGDAEVDIIDHFSDKKVIKSMKLSKLMNVKVNTWLANDLSHPLDVETMTVKDMKNIFHQMYVSLCETLGPVKADQVLNKSIGHVEQLNTGYSVSALI